MHYSEILIEARNIKRCDKVCFGIADQLLISSRDRHLKIIGRKTPVRLWISQMIRQA